MTEPDYPLKYTGDDNADLVYGDYVKIIQDPGPGTRVVGRYTLTGHWVEVEEYCFGRRCWVRRGLVEARE